MKLVRKLLLRTNFCLEIDSNICLDRLDRLIKSDLGKYFQSDLPNRLPSKFNAFSISLSSVTSAGIKYILAGGADLRSHLQQRKITRTRAENAANTLITFGSDLNWVNLTKIS